MGVDGPEVIKYKLQQNYIQNTNSANKKSKFDKIWKEIAEK